MEYNKLNSLKQEILIQEELTVSNEINKLELYVNLGCDLNSWQNKRISTFINIFSSVLFCIISLYLLTLLAFSHFINLPFEIQKIIIFICSGVMFLIPASHLISISVSTSSINRRVEKTRHANIVMLKRLEDYYRIIKFDLDPEKYKVYDDDFVVDIDQNGCLIKYVRFYSEDGSITTRPFKDLQELREFIDATEDKTKFNIINNNLISKIRNIEEEEEDVKSKFNEFSLIENTTPPKAVVEPANINYIFLANFKEDLLPAQYENKIFKWFTKNEYRDATYFADKLKCNLLGDSWNNGNKVITDGSWIVDNLSTGSTGLSNFFKNYDLQKSITQTSDVQTFVNTLRNFDLEKDETINWEDTIDPKDIHHEKLHEFENKVRERETIALELTEEQLRQEAIQNKKMMRTMRVELVDDNEIDVFEKYDPYLVIKKELEKQEKINREVGKTKSLLLSYGINDFDFDNLSVKELKQISKSKIKEAKELDKIRILESQDDLLRLENEIKSISAESYKETHGVKEKFQIDGRGWLYHDGEGNYFNLVNEAKDLWELTENPSIVFEREKESRIENLRYEFKNIQEQKQENANNEALEKQEKINLALKQKASKLELRDMKKQETKNRMREVKETKKENTRKNKEFIKFQNEKEKENYKEREITKKNKSKDDSTEYIELNAANEPYQNDEGKWMYHDGNGKYFISDENNEWSETSAPIKGKNKNKEIIDKTKEETKQRALEAKEALRLAKQRSKENSKLEKNMQKNATKSLSLNDEKDDIINNTENNGDQKPKAAEPFQDENGIWWYIDENGNYYYGDESGNWIPHQG